MRALFFDLDGTLLGFERECRNVLADAFRDVRGEAREECLETYEEAFARAFGRHEPDPYRRAFRATGGDPGALCEALYERELEACEPPTGAAANLARLAEECRLGVLTDGVPGWQRGKLEASGLAGYFETVVASYEAGAHKPAVAPYRLAEERLPADAYAMVGDADVGVDGARNAGWVAHRYEGGGFVDLPDALGW